MNARILRIESRSFEPEEIAPLFLIPPDCERQFAVPLQKCAVEGCRAPAVGGIFCPDDHAQRDDLDRWLAQRAIRRINWSSIALGLGALALWTWLAMEIALQLTSGAQ